MAKFKVPGLKGASGNMGGGAYKPGKYILDIEEVRIEPNGEKNFTRVVVRGEFIDGPAQDNGRDIKGAPFTTGITILEEGHRSYEQWAHIGVNELKALTTATGTATNADAFDPDELVGKTVEVTLRQKKGDDGEVRNEVRKWAKDPEA